MDKLQAHHNAALIHRFSGLANQLADRGIAVLVFSWSARGWNLVVEREREAVRFASDSLEGNLVVEESPVYEMTFSNEWTEKEKKKFKRGNQEGMLKFVKKYLSKRFP